METIMKLNPDAVDLFVICKVLRPSAGVKIPLVPDPFPEDVLSCLYQQDAVFSDYDDSAETCRARLVVKKNQIEQLKTLLNSYNVPFENGISAHYDTKVVF